MSQLMSLLLLLFLCNGCASDDKGIELQFQLPEEPEGKVRLEIIIDKSAEPPVFVGSNTYAIQFSKDGKARVKSPALLQKFHQIVLATPTQSLRRFDGYKDVNSGVKKAVNRENRPGGEVRSWTIDEGSKYWWEFEILDGQ